MSRIYNSLPRIEEAAQLLPALQTSVLPELKSLLVDYQLDPQFGIVFVHRHFSLDEDKEQVVDLNGPDTVVSSVFRNGRPDKQIVDEFRLDLPDKFSVVPAKFVVRDELIPYEYKCVPKEQERAYKLRSENLPLAFLKEWYTILERYLVPDTMGLVDTSVADHGDGFERSDNERRLNIVTTGIRFKAPELGLYIPTLWGSRLGQPARACCCGGASPQPLPGTERAETGSNLSLFDGKAEQGSR
jgi:hypothetical protein